MLELYFLLISIIIIICAIYYKQHTETYEDYENYYLSSCPSGYNTFYNNGYVICCNGEIVANKCISNVQCTINGKGTPNMPDCITTILNEYKEKGKKACPSSFSYFEDNTAGIKGCTNGKLNDTLTGPRKFKQPTCTIYKSTELNNNSKDSCYNQKMLDDAKCFGNNCTKQIIQPIPNKPVLIGIGFTDHTGMHKIAYTRKSFENYLNVINPEWKNQGLDLPKNINVAEVSKAYYVDRTMSENDIQL